MLPKRNLLNLSHSFQKLRTTGKRERIGPLTVFWRHEHAQTFFQISVVVPSSLTKLKPTRNRIRRLIYHNLRKNTARFPQTLQAVIMVYEDLTQWEPQALTQMFQRLDESLSKTIIKLKTDD